MSRPKCFRSEPEDLKYKSHPGLDESKTKATKTTTRVEKIKRIDKQLRENINTVMVNVSHENFIVEENPEDVDLMIASQRFNAAGSREGSEDSMSGEDREEKAHEVDQKNTAVQDSSDDIMRISPQDM